MKKVFRSTLQKMDSAVWGLYFDIPDTVSKVFLEKNVKRFVYSFDNGKKIHRAMLSRGDGQYFLYVNKSLMKELGYSLGTEVEITMEEDQSEYGMPLPEELEEAFGLFPEGHEHFEALTPGKQRTLIYMVDKPKRVETRVKKAVQILEYLEHYKGKLDFKELNNWFKLKNNI
ncbi:MAG: YdeI/OmpD-associated family protein [Saprospiraceae bacterium]|nr:YdeI/OmpD-associated family protein [Saprospiraceae bacterium]